MWLPLPEVMALRAREVLGAVLVFERLARGWCSPVCDTPFVYSTLDIGRQLLLA